MRRYFLPLWLAASMASPVCAFAQASTFNEPPARRDAEVPLVGDRPSVPTAADGLQPGALLTLDQALSLAGARSHAMSAAQFELEATDGAVRQADTRLNPELSTTVEDIRPATRTTTAVVSMPFELGDKRAARVAFAERARDVARAELARTTSDLRATVIATFFRVLVAQERASVAQRAAELAARGADVAGRRVAAGKISPVDEARSRVEQANAELEVGEARTELAVARLTLAALWGSTSPGFVAVAGSLDVLPSGLNGQALLLELNNSPALVAGRVQIEHLDAGVAVERSKRTPNVTITLGARRDNDLGLTQAVVGISMPLPIFDRNEGAIHAAGRRALKAHEEYQGTRVRVATELQQSANRLSGARATAETLRDTVVPAAQRAYEASTRGFEAGKFGLLDVLDSQRALLHARIRYLDALGVAHQAATEIDRLLGR